MSIGRREFLKTTGVSVGGVLLAGCEIVGIQDPYRAYLDYIDQHAITLATTGKIHRFIELPEVSFQQLNRRVNEPLLIVQKTPAASLLAVPDDDVARRFAEIVRSSGSQAVTLYRHDQYRAIVYHNADTTTMQFRSDVADGLLDWAVSEPVISGLLLQSPVEHKIHVGNYFQNPLIPQSYERMINSVTILPRVDQGDVQQAFTVVNLLATDPNTLDANPDVELVVEMMQAILSGDLLQYAAKEVLANSIGPAYFFASREKR